MSGSTKLAAARVSEQRNLSKKRKASHGENAPHRKQRPVSHYSPKQVKKSSLFLLGTSGHSLAQTREHDQNRAHSAAEVESVPGGEHLLERRDERKAQVPRSPETSRDGHFNTTKNDIAIMEDASDGEDRALPPTDATIRGGSKQTAMISSDGTPAGSSTVALDVQKGLLRHPLRFVQPCSINIEPAKAAGTKRRLTDEAVIENNKRRRLTACLSTSMPSTASTTSKSVSLGLRNPHVLCYRRSVLQSLLNIPVLVDWLVHRAKQHRTGHDTQQSRDGKNPSGCLFCALASLAEDMWRRRRITSLSAFDRSIRELDPHRIHDWTRSAVQADAHEFLHALADYMMDPKHGFNSPLPIAQGLFGLRVAREWTCTTCNLVHTAALTDETGLQLPITSPSDGTLTDYIDRYFEHDYVDARCENEYCPSNPPRARKGQKDPALPRRRRRVQVASTPEVLFVQLIRFQSNYVGNGRVKTTKLKKPVAYSRHLNLARYAMPASWREAPTSDARLRYRLSSVVAHSGSKDSGHYIAYVETQAGTIAEISDESVRGSCEAEMLRPSGGFVPYILTYVRDDKPATKRREAPTGQGVDRLRNSTESTQKLRTDHGISAPAMRSQAEPPRVKNILANEARLDRAPSSLSPSPSALGMLSIQSNSSEEDRRDEAEEQAALDGKDRASLDFMRRGGKTIKPAAGPGPLSSPKKVAWLSQGKRPKFRHGRARMK